MVLEEVSFLLKFTNKHSQHKETVSYTPETVTSSQGRHGCRVLNKMCAGLDVNRTSLVSLAW